MSNLLQRKSRKSGEIITRAAEIRADDVNADSREVPVSFSSQTNEVSFWGVPEILLHEKQAVNLSHLERTGSVLFNHNPDAIVGRPKDISLDEKARVARAVIAFDSDPEADRIFKKVQGGSLRGVSVGFRVQKWQILDKGQAWDSPGGQRFEGPLDIAIKWTPKEFSLTPIPADGSVGVKRNDQGDEEVINPEEDFAMKPELRAALVKRGMNPAATEEEAQAFMLQLASLDEKRQETTTGAAAAVTTTENRSAEVTVQPKQVDARAAVAEERTRVADIGQITSLWPEHPEIRAMERELISDGTSVEAARKQVHDKLAELRKPLLTAHRVDFGEEEYVKFREASQDWLLQRIGKLEDKDTSRLERRANAARDVECYNLFDLARSTLTRSGHKLAGMSRDAIVLRAFSHTTSDYPKILENVAQKVLLKHWAEAPSTYESLVNFTSATDFKNMTRYKLGDSGSLVLTPEGAPMAEGSVPESKGSYAVSTYTKRFGITRQAVINDDMSALNQIPALMGAAARRTVNQTFWALLTSASGIGPTLDEDSVALFATTHASGANYTNGPLVLAAAGLGTAKALMRLQKGLVATGETAPTLNITPRYLVVPVAQEMAALQVVAPIQPALSTSVNPFVGAFQIIVEPLLDGATNGGTAWYLVADPSQWPGAEAAFLNGQREPSTIRVEGDNVLGVEWGVYLDFGFKFLEHRSWYRAKNA